MTDLPEYVNGLPNLSGREDLIQQAMEAGAACRLYADRGGIDFARVKSASAIALHMHSR